MKSILAPAVFADRRARLMAQMKPRSIAIVPSARMQSRNSDVDYPFRQDSDFYYLSGFDEPNAVLVLLPNREAGEYVMFCQDRDPEKEIWHGYRVGPDGVRTRYGVDQAFAIDAVDAEMPKLLDGCERIYYAIGSDETLDGQVRGWLNAIRAHTRQGAEPPSEMVMLDHLLHEMRLFKSPEEAELMRRAGEISAQAHIRAMQQCSPGMSEYQLEAEIIHHFATHGCRQAAYPSIVGGGANACVLHYTENRDLLKEGDLVLIDAGCELDYYAGDITRTFPVDGIFSHEQRALYTLVLEAQKACIEMIRPGTLWDQIHDRSVEVLTEGLIQLGLLHGELEQLIETGAYREFYMHRVGHWLGMDVHDVGDYKVKGQWRPLEPGMVMTVEPGIYVSPLNEKVEARWRGIGIRIEDDVLVTGDGCEVLTASVPKEIDEIEALMTATHTA